MKKETFAAIYFENIVCSVERRHPPEIWRPLKEFTNLCFIVAGFGALLLLSFIGWGYGVIQNRAVTGLPRRRRTKYSDRKISRAF